MLALVLLVLGLQVVVVVLLVGLRQQLAALGERCAAPPVAPAPPPAVVVTEPLPEPAGNGPPPPAPQPQTAAPAPANSPLVDQFNLQVNLVANLPIQMVEALAGPAVAEVVALRASELDAALYRRWEAAELQAAGLPAPQAEELTAQLAAAQRSAIEQLAARGLRRIQTSSGSPFESLRVVPDPDEPPRWTDRPELDGRVAAVQPGRGGWELAGQVICPTRAQRYVYRGETGPTDR